MKHGVTESWCRRVRQLLTEVWLADFLSGVMSPERDSILLALLVVSSGDKKQRTAAAASSSSSELHPPAPSLRLYSTERRTQQCSAEISSGTGEGANQAAASISMARRKQRAPKRTPAYDSDDVEAPARQNEDFAKEDSTTAENPLGNNVFRKDDFFQKSEDEHCSTTAEFSETDSELHINESNEPMSDIESSSNNNEDNPVKECLTESSEKSVCSSDSLEQIKAIYNDFLSNSLWSSMSQSREKRFETSSSSSSSSPGGNCYDWHQSAVARTLQQVSEKQLHPQSETNLFSTVQLYRQSARVYGSIFSGASKFHCKSCSASYDTLVDLTVHMNDTGHYRDDNHEEADKSAKSWSKPRKRSLMEMEGKEDAQKVLRCMYCGHSFESLQDLSVHMIKTKHYQKVPLKEPGTSIAAVKVISSFKKKGVPVKLDITKLNATDQKASSGGSEVNVSLPKFSGVNKKESVRVHKCVSSTAQIKSQVLRCMECRESFECLQQLRAHIMQTGHFVKGSEPLQKKDNCIFEQQSLPEKFRIKNKNPKEKKCSSTPSPNGTIESPNAESKRPLKKSEIEKKIFLKEIHCKAPGNDNNLEDRYSISSTLDYLTEEDLKESPKMNLDILKSLENTVTSAINKAQKGTPSWGGYQSIHAAYQLQNKMKPSLYNSSIELVRDVDVPCSDKSQLSPSPQCSAPSPKVNLYAMEELVKKVTHNIAEETEKDKDEQVSLSRHFITSSTTSVDRKSASSSPTAEGLETLKNKDNKITDSDNNAGERDSKKFNESFTTSLAFYEDSAIITVHPEPKQPFVSPLNVLQSVMNLHLDKATNSVKPVKDPLSMLLKMSNSMAERAAGASAPISTSKPGLLHPDVDQIDKDQPIDLSKGKRNQCLFTASLPGKMLNSLPALNKTDLTDTIKCTQVSSVHESALSDISDMLRNLSHNHALNSQTSSHKAESSSIDDCHTSNTGDDASIPHKRKGRQSQWNPQHLLILQAQFTSCLRKTADGKYIISDLSSQERMVISHVTGLSMTTISHWLANVKYQLRRTGRTKFLKNVDSGHPVFFCSECATQIQTRSTYISHLESHLGFRLQDMTKFSFKNSNRTIAQHSKNILDKAVLPFL